MSQNVVIAGTTYNGVPSVSLNKSGGGIAKFVDSSGATVSSNDVALGKTAYAGGQEVIGTGLTTSYITLLELTLTNNSGVDVYSYLSDYGAKGRAYYPAYWWIRAGMYPWGGEAVKIESGNSATLSIPISLNNISGNCYTGYDPSENPQWVRFQNLEGINYTASPLYVSTVFWTDEHSKSLQVSSFSVTGKGSINTSNTLSFQWYANLKDGFIDLAGNDTLYFDALSYPTFQSFVENMVAYFGNITVTGTITEASTTGQGGAFIL